MTKEEENGTSIASHNCQNLPPSNLNIYTSAISERQDTTAYLRVLAKALRNYGAPGAIVTDSGGVFYSKRAMAIYEALDIRKERIDPRQSWQNYIEAHFGIMWN